jgi:hypothetical protein
MKKILGILLLLGVLPTLSAQKIFWSELTREDVLQAIQTSQSFLKNLETGKRDSLKNYIPEDSIFVGAQSWFSRDLFLNMAIERAQEISLQNVQLTGYRFDDFLEQYDQNEILDDVYPVFDNHSVLIRVNYQFNRNTEQVLLVMKKTGVQWSVAGFHGFGLIPDTSPEQELSRREFRMEKIAEAGIAIPIPSDFSEADRMEDQVNFYLKGETERDAVFQILIDELKAKVYYYTYKFVEFSNQQYELSELVVRYLPFGILFEYTVMDTFGSKNKGITVGLKSDNKMVIIQLYAFYDVFEQRKEEFFQVFNHLER